MTIVIVLLTAFLLLDCALLILLVLIQLPKKEAGMGLAFGAGATDALFGAGSGNALTQLTKYAAGIFFVLVFVLSILAQGAFKRNTSAFEEQLKQEAKKLQEAQMATNSVPAGATNPSVFKQLSTTNSTLQPTQSATPSIPVAPTGQTKKP